MVHIKKVYQCDKCRKRFSSYIEAHDCEIDHVVDAAIRNTQEAIKLAFQAKFPTEDPRP